MRTHCRVCGRSHRLPSARGRCIRDAAVWIQNTSTRPARWALLAHCDGLTVTLHPRRREAENARTFIDRTGCGHLCSRHHEIVDARGLNLEAVTR